MSTLRQIRHERAAFDGRFFEKSPLFWPIGAPAALFANYTDWPEVGEYDRLFEGREAPVRFEPQPPRPRRFKHTSPIDPATLYDGRITLDRCVPTRRGSWHDYLNALVWSTFPRSKRAIHARQHEAIVRALPAESRTLPAARSRAHDALALVDEGGVVRLEDGTRVVRVVFGHALFEGLVLGVRATIAREVVVKVDAIPAPREELLALADARLAERVADVTLAPEALPRVALADCAPRDAAAELV